MNQLESDSKEWNTRSEHGIMYIYLTQTLLVAKNYKFTYLNSINSENVEINLSARKKIICYPNLQINANPTLKIKTKSEHTKQEIMKLIQTQTLSAAKNYKYTRQTAKFINNTTAVKIITFNLKLKYFKFPTCLWSFARSALQMISANGILF